MIRLKLILQVTTCIRHLVSQQAQLVNFQVQLVPAKDLLARNSKILARLVLIKADGLAPQNHRLGSQARDQVVVTRVHQRNHEAQVSLRQKVLRKKPQPKSASHGNAIELAEPKKTLN
jgi:hypothetical protein